MIEVRSKAEAVELARRLMQIYKDHWSGWEGSCEVRQLKLVGGLTTMEIARAYLTTEATVAQWVVRTKRTLADADAAIEEPSEAERAEQLTTVLR